MVYVLVCMVVFIVVLVLKFMSIVLLIEVIFLECEGGVLFFKNRKLECMECDGFLFLKNEVLFLYFEKVVLVNRVIFMSFGVGIMMNVVM